MTEDQAKEKWCPYVRHFSGSVDDEVVVDPAANRWGRHLNPGPCRCIASECMAWRYHSSSRSESERHGYCGLAGIPEFGPTS